VNLTSSFGQVTSRVGRDQHTAVMHAEQTVVERHAHALAAVGATDVVAIVQDQHATLVVNGAREALAQRGVGLGVKSPSMTSNWSRRANSKRRSGGMSPKDWWGRSAL
jgi:hypothetical protein